MNYYLATAGLIAIIIIGAYAFGIGPTSMQIDQGKFVDQNFTQLNQSGKTEPYSTVQINGEPVQVDANGNFYKIIDIKNGSTTLVITSRAPFKSQTILYAFVGRLDDGLGVSANWSTNNSVINPSKYHY